MRISKDEAAILYECVKKARFDLAYETHIEGFSNALIGLENRLWDYHKDSRRTGRTSDDDYNNKVRRFINLQNKKYDI